MKTVLRGDNGEITHKFLFELQGIYYWLTVADYDIFLGHEITHEEIENFFGEDKLSNDVRDIANLNYSAEHLRYDILTYNEIFNDKILRTNDFLPHVYYYLYDPNYKGLGNFVGKFIELSLDNMSLFRDSKGREHSCMFGSFLKVATEEQIEKYY